LTKNCKKESPTYWFWTKTELRNKIDPKCPYEKIRKKDPSRGKSAKEIINRGPEIFLAKICPNFKGSICPMLSKTTDSGAK